MWDQNMLCSLKLHYCLHLSLIVAGIKKDDEVICPSMSYIAGKLYIIRRAKAVLLKLMKNNNGYS